MLIDALLCIMYIMLNNLFQAITVAPEKLDAVSP